jgi:hypothetical protein
VKLPDWLKTEGAALAAIGVAKRVKATSRAPSDNLVEANSPPPHLESNMLSSSNL